MLTPQQEKEIKLRILDSGIKYYEVYQELSDHYCSAIEDQLKAGSSFEQALSTTHAEFGQNGGLQKLQRSFAASAIKYYRHQHWQEFKHWFSWPHILYVAAAALLTYIFTDIFRPEVITVGIIILSLVPFIALGVTDRTVREYIFSTTTPKTLRGVALRQQAIFPIGFLHLLFFGGEVDWLVSVVKQLHHAGIAGLLVLYYLWYWSFYTTVRKTKPKFQ